ncbi:hypothetical protein A3C25_03035 [Candidatus Roizmanbacteria bacterium RIFCSPHIGHO2_02_FULL_38_11]|uniref:MalT-like TPR region domain-containing protein n=1 Tax=Candidatus Roizmanbacteria bacterium RIFCSPHIGHO2_02_FULL_38_11 TaxID=1802039 RepID=A0A1F7H1H3_9BACT|nr:MAG: hypothetical protein A3C25_03035 [Candidatus Roizmanbacteria bacterium RIFCSPHIGHO2_02_FULL_38_11]
MPTKKQGKKMSQAEATLVNAKNALIGAVIAAIIGGIFILLNGYINKNTPQVEIIDKTGSAASSSGNLGTDNFGQSFTQSNIFSPGNNDNPENQSALGFFKAALQYQSEKNWKAARQSYAKAEELYKKINDIVSLGHIKNNLGNIETNQNNMGSAQEHYNEAINLYQKAIDQSNKADDKKRYRHLQASTYYNLALLYRNNIKDDDKAFEFCQKAADTIDTTAKERLPGRIYFTMGMIKFDKKDYKASVEYFKKSSQYYKNLQADDLMAESFYFLARSYNDLFKQAKNNQEEVSFAKQAIEAYKVALPLFEKNQDDKKVYTLFELGNLEEFLGEYKESVAYFTQAAYLYQLMKEDYNEGVSWERTGLAYQQIEDHHEENCYNAHESWRKALILYKKEKKEKDMDDILSQVVPQVGGGMVCWDEEVAQEFKAIRGK